MHSQTLRLMTALFLSTITTNLYAENNKAQIEQVEKLFKLTQMEKQIQQSVENILQLQLRQKPQANLAKRNRRAFFQKIYRLACAQKRYCRDVYENIFGKRAG